jgi:hypothetical protein
MRSYCWSANSSTVSPVRRDHGPRPDGCDGSERVTFHNAENGFCVLRAKARGHRDLVTVVGHAAVISAGEWITASGEWINDRAHGQLAHLIDGESAGRKRF